MPARPRHDCRIVGHVLDADGRCERCSFNHPSPARPPSAEVQAAVTAGYQRWVQAVNMHDGELTLPVAVIEALRAAPAEARRELRGMLR